MPCKWPQFRNNSLLKIFHGYCLTTKYEWKYTSCELIYAGNLSFMQGDDALQVLQEEVNCSRTVAICIDQ